MALIFDDGPADQSLLCHQRSKAAAPNFWQEADGFKSDLHIESYQNNFLLPSVLSAYILSLALPIVYILMVAFRADHRHLPDLVGDSQVIKIKKKTNIKN